MKEWPETMEVEAVTRDGSGHYVRRDVVDAQIAAARQEGEVQGLQRAAVIVLAHPYSSLFHVRNEILRAAMSVRANNGERNDR